MKKDRNIFNEFGSFASISVMCFKDGTFKASPHSKLAYGTMVFVRVLIVNDSSNKLSRAAAISIRYSAVRKQSQLKEK